MMSEKNIFPKSGKIKYGEPEIHQKFMDILEEEIIEELHLVLDRDELEGILLTAEKTALKFNQKNKNENGSKLENRMV